MSSSVLTSKRLYIILFLHQTTTFVVMLIYLKRCISYYSYIKPQRLRRYAFRQMCCISYYSYIKPQPGLNPQLTNVVVYHTIPTSNHNCRQSLPPCLLLYIILFLHQTTTLGRSTKKRCLLYIILFLHQTTTLGRIILPATCCISYYSYIKPQPGLNPQLANVVVYHTIPTSNHNLYVLIVFMVYVVYHTIPTSNHNCGGGGGFTAMLYIILFLHQTTT